MNPQLYPLEIDPKTGEPFLRVEGFDDIILTPPRRDDGPQFIPYFNDPRVNEWMASPPLPYLLADAEHWLDIVIPLSDGILRKLEDAREEKEMIFTNGSPMVVIRKVNHDGSQIFIGACDLTRCTDFGEVVWKEEGDGDGLWIVDKINKANKEKINLEIDVGDPEIIWEFGDYLAPEYHGRGIMTAVVKTQIEKWGIPRMNARRIRAGTFAGNVGSQKVFLKNGFKHIMTLPDHMVVKGKSKTMEVLEWRASES